MTDYSEFLDRKTHYCDEVGFDPIWVPDFLFDFQRELMRWATHRGRAAIFADTGLGKTPMQLVWAENVCRKTNGNVLILTPLAVSHQTIREGEKFGIECRLSTDGSVHRGITVTNYEKLHYFNANDFAGLVCDESGILKNFEGKRKAMITRFASKRPYRLLCTATAAPNDYSELGTSSEALGELEYSVMLERFFKNTQNICNTRQRWVSHGGPMPKWIFKKHAEQPFWRWVCSWARAIRRPSDLGFDDSDFELPQLIERETIVENTEPLPGEMFVRPAFGLQEQLQERKMTIQQRCEMVAEKVNHNRPALVWCHLNAEGDLLEELIPDALQVAGSQSDEVKEERLLAFVNGDLRVLVSKPKIAGFGLNLQHCNHVTFFPSHSYEQYYQGIRRCYRYGQTRPVTVDIITTGGELDVLKNLRRKAEAADKMFSELVAHMNDSMRLFRDNPFQTEAEMPAWLR